MHSDVIVIGSGIAGLSVAYFLAQANQRVCVLDSHSTPFGGASGAAGAFLSPMMGRGSAMMSFVNRSLAFSLELYGRIAPDALVAGGVLRYPKPNESPEEFRVLEAYLGGISHRPHRGGLFFPGAGVIAPDRLADALLGRCCFIGGVQAGEPHYEAGRWCVGEYAAPVLVVATGAYPTILPDGWMGRRGVWGERLALKAPHRRRYNTSAAVAISATLPDHTVAIGATHRRNDHSWRIDPAAAQTLLEEAVAIDSRIDKATVVDIKGGMRPANNDYLPAVGPFMNAPQLAKEQPLLFKGTALKRPAPYYPGLFVHTGHGGRGFVTAPYTGYLLAKQILNQANIPEYLLPDRLLLRYFRRQREPGCYDRTLQGVF
jgi:tRNA 5-methylaminomethyl-2-thiouridine biosynthesis bifunctional protein